MVTTKLRSTYWMEYSFLFVWRWLLFDYILLLLILLLASIVMYYFVTFGKKQFLWYFGYLIWLRLCKQSIFIKATQTMSIAQTRVKHVLNRKNTYFVTFFQNYKRSSVIPCFLKFRIPNNGCFDHSNIK